MNQETVTARFRSELVERTQRATALMREHGLRGLIVYSDTGNAGNARYLTNFRPFFGVEILILREDGERALINTFVWDAPRGQLASGVERIYSGFDTGDLVLKALEALGLGPDAALGLVGSNLMPFDLYAAVTEGGGRPLPLDVHAAYEEMRLIKSPFEQELLRKAAGATDAAIAAALEEAAAGVSELELAATLEYQMKRAGAEGIAFPASVASGPNTEKPVSLPTSRRFERGDLVMIDVGATWEGYSADVTRSFVVGSPTERQRDVYGAVAAALEASTRAVRPGTVANELHRVAVESLAQHDLDPYFTHRVGHGIGLETSLEAPDLQRNEMPLRPGMTFCLEPGVYIPGFGGIKIEDDIIVGSDGPEVISTTTRELLVV